jgi:hypothetical protein
MIYKEINDNEFGLLELLKQVNLLNADKFTKCVLGFKLDNVMEINKRSQLMIDLFRHKIFFSRKIF